MNKKEVSLIWKRLSILLEAGTSLPQALDITALQSGAKAAKALANLKAGAVSGRPLWKVMEDQPKVFANYSVSLVKIGETAGTLPESLAHLSEELKQESELKRKIISALIYPCVILISTIGIVLLLLLYVFPKIMPIFQAFNTHLPWSTRLLLGLYSTLSNHWLYILAGSLVAAACSAVLFGNRVFRRFAGRVILDLPLIGKFYKCYLNIIFARALATLLKGDARLPASVKVAGNALGNNLFRENINLLAEELLTGVKLSSVLASRPKLFLPVVVQMVSAGERSGNLHKSLLYAAQILKEDLDIQTRELTGLIEPALMVGMGLLVGLIALSIISPIYGITRDLHS